MRRRHPHVDVSPRAPRRFPAHPVSLGLLLLAACTSCRREPAAAQPPVVRVQQLRTEPVQVVTRFNGTIVPRQSADVSFTTAGAVARVLQVQASDGSWRDIGEGDVIETRQPLASLDTTDDHRDYDSAAMRLALARRASAVAQRLILRAQPLDMLWLGSALDDDRLVLEQFQLCLSYESADAAMRQAKRRLDAADLWPPFEHATVIEKQVRAGQPVSAGHLAFRLADLTEARVDAQVPQELRQRMTDRPALAITSAGLPGRSF